MPDQDDDTAVEPPQETTRPAAAVPRKRRAHRKSRAGCANCKLRRVKCDEQKPECQRCVAFHMACSYGTKDAGAAGDGAAGHAHGSDADSLAHVMRPAIPMIELELNLTSYGDRPGRQRSREPGVHIPYLPTRFSIPLADGTEYMLPASTPELLQVFAQTVRILSLHGPTAKFKSAVLQLAIAQDHRWLFHSILVLALVHQPAADPAAGARLRTIHFHHFHARTLLAARLAVPVKTLAAPARDAVWAAITLMCHLTFSAYDTRSAADAWPVRRPQPRDLAWLQQCLDNAAMFDMVQALGADSLFSDAARALRGLRRLPTSLAPSHGWGAEFDGLPRELAALLDLQPGATTAARNTYHALASIVAQCLECEAAPENVLMCFAFLRVMDERFLALVRVKDLPALVLMAWWYARLVEFDSEGILRRIRVEGEALCVYIESWGASSPDIMAALEYPKRILRANPSDLQALEDVMAGVSLTSSLFQIPRQMRGQRD
ncbi:hypothetical protein BROUX41_003400 [Berkeleyomyces rouxiae]|uniref:uncharacterized protein n=1 Tax=Berkeleyomyces rouxiae TaxID=2035830 RepID=UPI003B7C67B8